MAPQKKKKLTKKLIHKYRLVILNEETFEERLSFRLSRLNVFVVLGVSIIVLIALTTVLIAFTPLREYIPGYSSTALRHRAMGLVYKTDSLEQVIDNNNRYFKSIQQVLKGDTLAIDQIAKKDTLDRQKTSADEVSFTPIKADSTLRRAVERHAKYNVFYPAVHSMDFKLFPPVRGEISSSYNADEEHYAVDIVTPEKQAVKATAEGVVIFSEWTVQTGYVIILDHGNGLVSVYKHNAELVKKQGDQVKAGEVIAMTGNTGEYSTGPHLHFELWRNGYPIDPTEFLDFEY